MFLCTIFDEWFRHDAEYLAVQLFAETALMLTGAPPGLCTLSPECGRVLVVERDGSVYSCDHFVRPAFRLGSVRSDSLSALVDSPAQAAFGRKKREQLTAQCRECRYLPLCGGGCPKDRFALSDEGEPGHPYLCRGLYRFFSYAGDRLLALARLQRQTGSAAKAAFLARREEKRRWEGVSRNDPCPCGSGKKAKKCCWDSRP